MSTDNLEASLRRDAELYNERASNYGGQSDDLEHAIPAELEEPYRADIEAALGPLQNYGSILEVGAGNGVLTQLLNKWGCSRITGTDISEGMLALARQRLPNCEFKLIDRENDPGLFGAASFDLIISRQVVCHLMDPISVFSSWKGWLKPGGRIAIIDGLWTRRDWGPQTTAAGALVDVRPLSCTQTWATVSYLLRQAGLTVLHQAFLDRTNEFAKRHFAIGESREPIFRYIVTATTGS